MYQVWRKISNEADCVKWLVKIKISKQYIPFADHSIYVAQVFHIHVLCEYKGWAYGVLHTSVTFDGQCEMDVRDVKTPRDHCNVFLWEIQG